MSCYLCAYMSSKQPQTHQPLQTGSPINSTDDLGTCTKCNVWACSEHSQRPATFLCAMCLSATAIQQAACGTAAGSAAAAQAHLVGDQLDANSPLLRETHEALAAVVADGQQAGGEEDLRSLVALNKGEPNLVTNLGDWIVREYSVHAAPAVRGHEPQWSPGGYVSVQVVGGAVREAFSGHPMFDPSDEAVTTVAGAMILAYSIADDTVAAQVSAGREVPSLPRPWQVTRPVLLDPVIWMVGSAYPRG
ncbi:hypothetical protein P3T36_005834 [Kitasatospora sp. MAP12-15]|uniref:hypothetical protein n=1 Tax=unclassified Kitasatospora TaxID=2633591 RepID=UPI0024755C5B|nr:hypothetical protein [Kitasatospora sp. MAP12-44]MDH6110108.1 hypothetical protein [Kitasatospora sp. MAP12-44]